MSITCCREKAVLVTVYEEKPRTRSRSSENGLSSRHHHHYHHIYHDVSKHDKRGRGYNRRAELLEYARQLRATSNSKAPPTTQILSAERKPNRATTSSCLGKWESLIPRFFKTTMNHKGKKKSSVFSNMKDLVKCLQVQEKGTFMSKLVSRSAKHHK